MNKLNQLRLRLGFKKFEWFKLPKVKDNFNSRQLLDFLYSPDGQLITPWQFIEEIEQLLGIYANLRPRTILEIGTANGGTLFLHSKLAADEALIISIDLPGGKFGGGYPEWKTPLYRKFAKSGQKIELLRANSHEISTLSKVKEVLNGKKLDYLFIDGDHTYDGVKKDFEMYSSLVNDTGIIVFHDVVAHPGSSCEVDKFWNEVKADYVYKEFINDPHQGRFGIGVLIKKRGT